MNIITNNCLSGHIYKDLLKEEYKNPFIWTLFEPDDYIDFIENFDKINFDNVLIESYNKKYDGMFYTLIDNKYKLKNVHIKFSSKDTKPRYDAHPHKVDLFYYKPWEYIYEKYISRLNRMKKETQKCVIIYEPSADINWWTKLANICKEQKIPALFFTDIYNENNNLIKTIYQERITYFGWQYPLLENHSNKILNFIKAL